MKLSSDDVPPSLLASILEGNNNEVDEALTPESVVCMSRLMCLACLLCGGDFDTKLDLCFAVADVDGVKCLSEEQANAFVADDAVAVVEAAMECKGDAPESIDWAVSIWQDEAGRRK